MRLQATAEQRILNRKAVASFARCESLQLIQRLVDFLSCIFCLHSSAR